MAQRLAADAIDVVYEAGASPDLWPVALDRLWRCVGGTHAVMIVETADFDQVDWAGFDTWPEKAFRRHIRQFRSFAARLPLNMALLIDDHVPPAEFRASDFYADVVQPIGGGEGLGMALNGRTGSATLMFGRPAGSPFDPARLRIASALLPHVRRAIGTTAALRMQALQVEAARNAADAAGSLVAVVDGQRRARFVGTAIDAVLRRGDGCRYEAGERIGDRAGILAAGVAALLRTDRRDLAPGTLRLPRDGDAPAWVVELRRVPGEAELTSLCFVEEGGVDAAVARHGLTPQEARVARIVAEEALDTAALAEKLGVSVNTARTHLARIFAKTGVRRQAELVALLRS